ncbi:hypothetical protein QJQ45_024045, partial [Haematococcus lacustris]
VQEELSKPSEPAAQPAAATDCTDPPCPPPATAEGRQPSDELPPAPACAPPPPSEPYPEPQPSSPQHTDPPGASYEEVVAELSPAPPLAPALVVPSPAAATALPVSPSGLGPVVGSSRRTPASSAHSARLRIVVESTPADISQAATGSGQDSEAALEPVPGVAMLSPAAPVLSPLSEPEHTQDDVLAFSVEGQHRPEPDPRLQQDQTRPSSTQQQPLSPGEVAMDMDGPGAEAEPAGWILAAVPQPQPQPAIDAGGGSSHAVDMQAAAAATSGGALAPLDFALLHPSSSNGAPAAADSLPASAPEERVADQATVAPACTPAEAQPALNSGTAALPGPTSSAELPLMRGPGLGTTQIPHPSSSTGGGAMATATCSVGPHPSSSMGVDETGNATTLAVDQPHARASHYSHPASDGPHSPPSRSPSQEPHSRSKRPRSDQQLDYPERRKAPRDASTTSCELRRGSGRSAAPSSRRRRRSRSRSESLGYERDHSSDSRLLCPPLDSPHSDDPGEAMEVAQPRGPGGHASPLYMPGVLGFRDKDREREGGGGRGRLCVDREAPPSTWSFEERERHRMERERAELPGNWEREVAPDDRQVGALLRRGHLVLVLDLDHTLLNSACFPDLDAETESQLSQRLFAEASSLPDSQRELYRSERLGVWTKLRPGVREFLARAAEKFEIWVRSAGSRPYAEAMASLLDPEDRYLGGRIIAAGGGVDGPEGPIALQNKRLLAGLEQRRQVALAVDDAGALWPLDARLALFVMERYLFFPSSRRRFGLERRSLLQINRDECPDRGMLMTGWHLIEGLHRLVFTYLNHPGPPGMLLSAPPVEPRYPPWDIRNVLADERRKVLQGVCLAFSRITPLDADPRAHPLWRMAQAYGAECATHCTDRTTHVVSPVRGTEKTRWAATNGRPVVTPAW